MNSKKADNPDVLIHTVYQYPEGPHCPRHGDLMNDDEYVVCGRCFHEADARLAEYAEREGRMRETWGRFQREHFLRGERQAVVDIGIFDAVDAALSGSSPCPHAAEVEKLKAELKPANEGMTIAHMVGYHKRDEEVRGLEEALALADKVVEAAEKFKESCDSLWCSPYPSADAILGNPEKLAELCAALSAYNAAKEGK
jgi:hypothetical protein